MFPGALRCIVPCIMLYTAMLCYDPVSFLGLYSDVLCYAFLWFALLCHGDESNVSVVKVRGREIGREGGCDGRDGREGGWVGGRVGWE